VDTSSKSGDLLVLSRELLSEVWILYSVSSSDFEVVFEGDYQVSGGISHFAPMASGLRAVLSLPTFVLLRSGLSPPIAGGHGGRQ
jgi:hypothetical protein